MYQNDRWFADLIDFSSTPSDNGKRTGLRRTKDGESYILVVQDVFSRFLWTEALVNKTPQAVAKAFEEILARAGTKPRSLTSDLGPEFEGPFRQMLEANGIGSFQTKKKTSMRLLPSIRLLGISRRLLSASREKRPPTIGLQN